MKIAVKRIYEPAASDDGYRILIDRLWPRGIKKEVAGIDEWCKEVAPSAKLRTWFGHDPEKWTEFKKKYKDELKDNTAWKELQELVQTKRKITLLYGARDEVHNQAVVLADLLRR